MKSALIQIGIAIVFCSTLLWFGYHVADKEWQAKWSARDADDAIATTVAERQQRELEQAYQSKIDKVTYDAHKQVADATADALAADAAADSLRESARRLSARASQTCGSATTTAGRAPAANASNVLADVLGQVEAAGRAMAAEADKRGIAGKACEQAYDGIRASSVAQHGSL